MTDDRKLPEGAAPYSRTAKFTADTVPDKLTHAHNTKPGVWGRLTVIQGAVRYFLEGEDEPLATVSAGETFIIRPEEWHYVRLSDDAEFFVEFCK